MLVGKLCVLKLQLQSGAVCAMAQAKPNAGRLEPSFEIFGGPYERDTAFYVADRQLFEKFGKGSRMIQTEGSELESRIEEPVPPVVATEGEVNLLSPAGPMSQTAQEVKPEQPPPTGSSRPSVDDVVGLCLLMIRTDLC